MPESLTGHPDLDEAIAEYIGARKEAEPSGAWEVEQAAWDKFYPLKVKYWQLEHPTEA